MNRNQFLQKHNRTGSRELTDDFDGALRELEEQVREARDANVSLRVKHSYAMAEAESQKRRADHWSEKAESMSLDLQALLHEKERVCGCRCDTDWREAIRVVLGPRDFEAQMTGVASPMRGEPLKTAREIILAHDFGERDAKTCVACLGVSLTDLERGRYPGKCEKHR